MINDSKHSSTNFSNRLPSWLIFLVPLILLVGLVIFFWVTNPIQPSKANLPPIENLNIQRIDINPDGFHIQITNAGRRKQPTQSFGVSFN